MLVAKLNSKYQVTIPRPVRDQLGLEIGDKLHCTHEEGVVFASKGYASSEGRAWAVRIRDRFQLTLPIKKMRVRSHFSNGFVVVEPTAERGFSIRAMHHSDPPPAIEDHARGATSTVGSPLGQSYPHPMDNKST